MAKYPAIVTTSLGLNVISEANYQSKAVIFTRVAVGDGDSGDTAFSDMTGMVNEIMTMDATAASNEGNGHFVIRATLDNSELTTGFYAREVGVFAKVDGGAEVLFAYTNGGIFVDYIPDSSTPIDAQIFTIDIIVGNAESLTLQVSDSTYATLADLSDHDASESAHAALLAAIAMTTAEVYAAWNESASGDEDDDTTVSGSLVATDAEAEEALDEIFG